MGADGLQHVLPRSHRRTLLDHNLLRRSNSPHELWDQFAFGPVAAADRVPTTRGGDGGTGVMEKLCDVSRDRQLGAGGARTVGIVSAKRVFLALAIEPNAGFVALVAVCDY